MKIIVTFLCSLNIFYSLFAQEIEPNNEISMATPITLISNSGTIKGSIDTIRDYDFFKFDIPGPGIITYAISDVPANISMQMELYDINKILIPKSKAGGGDGENYSREYKVCEGGTYYIKLYDTEGRFGGPHSNKNPYKLSIGYDNSDNYECNDELRNSTLIKLDTKIYGNIRTVGDYDFFKFNISGPGIITYAISDVPANISMQMELYDINKNLIPKSKVGGGDGENYSREYKVCEGGTYYIKLYDTEGRFGGPHSNKELYSLSIGYDNSDIYECNEDFSEAKQILACDTILAYIRSKQDTDYYKFTINSPTSLRLKFFDVPSTLALEIRVYNDLKNQIKTFSLNPGQLIDSIVNLSSSGLYFFKIIDRNQNSSLKPYSFKLYNNCNTATNDLDKIEVQLFPNPSQEEVYIKINKFDLIKSINVLNVTGINIFEFLAIKEITTINLHSIPQGLYLVKIETHTGNIKYLKLYRN